MKAVQLPSAILNVKELGGQNFICVEDACLFSKCNED